MLSFADFLLIASFSHAFMKFKDPEKLSWGREAWDLGTSELFLMPYLVKLVQYAVGCILTFSYTPGAFSSVRTFLLCQFPQDL